jgi:predicted O-linked N-acetylglucosamine transferase (SPINDLY family)
MNNKIDQLIIESQNLFNKGLFNDSRLITEKIILEYPNNYKAKEILALIFLKLEKLPEALKLILEAMKLHSDFLSFNYLGQIYHKMKNYDEAINNFNISIKIKSDLHISYVNRGSVFEDLENFDGAIKDYKKAIEINPKAYLAYNNIGNIFTKIGKFDEAFNNLKIATQSNKFLPFYNLGCLFNKINKNEEAIKSFNKSIEINPEHISSYKNRALTYLRSKKFIFAINDYKKIKEINEKNDDGTYFFCKSIINDWEDYKILTDEITNKIKNKIKIQPFYLLNFLDDNNIQNACCENYLIETKKSAFKINFLKNKKIKLGYFSADFNNHAVTRLIKDVLKFHDKDKFDISCFYLHPYKYDEETKLIEKYSDNFLDLKNYSTNEIVSLVRGRNLDIGIDLMGYTEHHQMSIFQERIAPIQINYLGYPGTIGKKFMNYIVADKILIPDNYRKYYLEKIIYLPNCYQPQYELVDTSKIDFDEKFDLSKKKFIYSNFCNSFKITPLIFKAWMQILNNVSNSILVLLENDETSKINLVKEAKKYNIDKDRLIFSKRTNYEKHVARYKHVNLFLDTFPYNGHTTSSEALKSNLLLVTLQGSSFQSRVSASIINNLKLNQLITSNIEDYIKLSVELAKNVDKYNELKDQLKNNLKIERISTNKIYTKNLETAFEEVYMKNQKNLPNENLYI